MATVHTRHVAHRGISIACRDHGGTGPDLVLMHGAGMDQRGLDRLVACLSGDFRVVTFDFRGHGRTPMAEWTMDIAIDDLEAVIAARRLTAPVVAGHSLGGMVAAEYARRHPGCTAAINLDGHGGGTAQQYVGKDPIVVADWLEEIHDRSEALLDSRLVRSLLQLKRLTGSRPAHPSAVAAVMAIARHLDLLALYREVRCPLQVFNAHAPAKGLAARLSRDADGMAAAYRAGIRRDLSALSRTHPNVVLTELDASHMLIRTHPAETATLMTAFLREHALQTG